jgi:hypothetical protein
MMYFLVLAALLELTETAPRMVSPHQTFEDCAKAAQDANKDERLKTEEARARGLRFVCVKLVMDV